MPRGEKLRAEVLAEFAEFEPDSDFEIAASWRTRRAAIDARWQAKLWAKTKASAELRAAHNAKRRAAYWRMKADPVRWARTKRLQAVYSSRQTRKRRKR